MYHSCLAAALIGAAACSGATAAGLANMLFAGLRALDCLGDAAVSHAARLLLTLVVDVGANTGVYTVMAGTITPDQSIVAFEPFPPVVEILKRKIVANGSAERVRLIEVALSDTSGTATLHLPDPDHGLVETSASLEPDFQQAHSVCAVRAEGL